MRTLPVLILAAIALSAYAASPEPLVEEKRIDFEAPFEYGSGKVCFHPHEPVGYAVTKGRLVTFDARTGATLGDISLDPTGGDTPQVSWQLRIVGDRLLASSNPDYHLELYDIDVPDAPRFLEDTRGSWNGSSVVATLDGFLVIRHDSNRFDLISTEPLGRVGPIPSALPGAFLETVTGSAVAGALPVLAVVERRTGAPELTAISTYDLVDGSPVLRFSRAGTPAVSSILVDRSGGLVLVTFYEFSPLFHQWTETIDAHTGVTLASWEVGSGIRSVFAEGDGLRLLQLDESGIDLLDLEDPARPRPIGRVDLPPTWPPSNRRVAPSSTSAVAFVAGATGREVRVVDVRAAAEISRLSVEGGEPAEILLQETAGGVRRGAIAVRHYDPDQVFLRGGLSHLELADLSNPAVGVTTGRFLRNLPEIADEVEAIGGSHLLVYEVGRNSLALVDLAKGEVAQVTGAADRLGRFDMVDPPEMRAAGRFALLAGPGGWERFVLTRGRLEPLGAWIPPSASPESLDAAELTATGTVIALGSRYENGESTVFLETSGVDGRTARISRVYGRNLGLAVAPDGGLVAVSRLEFGQDNGVDVYDVTDPSSPRLLWTLPEDITDAVFDPTGTRLLISGPLDGFEFWVRVFDARSGLPLGPPSQGIWKFFYHGIGTQWITDGVWRAIYWNWDFVGWDDALVDLSGPTPTLLRTYSDTGFAPEFAPRAGGGWYELRRNPWDRLAILVVGDPDGETVATDVIDADLSGIVAVRKGYAATARSTKSVLGVSLWRDDALLRPPAQSIPKIGTASGGHR